MSARSSLCVGLIIWLALAAARLVFDLIGKLWLVAIFDLLQIVCCITGLFGCLQKRRCLLVALLTSNLPSALQNVLLLLWYIGVFGAISRPILSAGLPYSFSFFLRYTPTCGSHFDLKRTIWVQHSCLLPYQYIEAAQAVIHIVLAIVTTTLSALLLVQIRRRKSAESVSSSITPYAQVKREHIAPTPIERNSKRKKRLMPAPDSVPCTSRSSDEIVDEEVESRDVYTKPMKPLRRGNEERNVTSLVSFDPKSATLLRIRQHLEAEQGNEDRQPTPSSTYDGLYERLRSRSSGSENAPASSSTVPFSGYKSRNASQDSVPSMFAPMLDSPSPKETSLKPSILSPGIRLSDQINASRSAPYKSAFRVQTNDCSGQVIGHYHAPNEIPLASKDEQASNVPVLTSGGLLV